MLGTDLIGQADGAATAEADPLGRPARAAGPLSAPGTRSRRWGVVVVVLAWGTACAPDHPAAVGGVRAVGCAAVPAAGTGALVAAGTVLTAAHTVAGATTVEFVRDGRTETANVLALDPVNDLALLRVADQVTAPLPAAAARPGRDTAAVAYVASDGAVRKIDVTIVRPVIISTRDVYLEADVERAGFELAGAIVPGDSGAPVLVGGELVGVVWARSNVALGRAYAIDATAWRPDPQADLARCAGTPP